MYFPLPKYGLSPNFLDASDTPPWTQSILPGCVLTQESVDTAGQSAGGEDGGGEHQGGGLHHHGHHQAEEQQN